MRTLLPAVLLLTATGCFVPRSAGFGQTAMALQPGQVEASLQPGLTYQINNAPPQQNGNTTVSTGSTSGLSFPAIEGNAAVGITDQIGLNVHLSSAGLQPGAKIAVLKGPLSVALLPEIAIGVFTNTSTQQGSSSTTTFTGFMGGFKALVSHESGVYGGLGYDFQSFSAGGAAFATGGGGGGQAGNAQDSSTSQTSHNIALAGGFNVELGALRIRPELAFMFSPAVTFSSRQNNVTTSQSGGSTIFIYPNVSFAVVGSSKKSGE